VVAEPEGSEPLITKLATGPDTEAVLSTSNHNLAPQDPS